MAVNWLTPAGSLGVLTERKIVQIPLSAISNTGEISYSLQAGSLPRGLRISGSFITGSPTEVKKFTEFRFVIRAEDNSDKKDRTFSLSIDGSDAPVWITPDGFLPVGENGAYFVLDNSYVNFRLDAYDADAIVGDVLEYYLIPNSGQLPPGLSLSKNGTISGFTDPIFSLEFNQTRSGSYDNQSYDITPFDIAFQSQTGFDSYLYDNQIFDLSEDTIAPRRISRQYAFSVGVTDGINDVTRLFQIYVVTEEFLQADNTLIQVDNNLFRADATNTRNPLWITDSYLGRFRANNYITIFLDVYDPPSLLGTTTYFLLNSNPDGSESILPPGMSLDTITGDIAGKVPYQAAVTKRYNFTLLAVNFLTNFSNINFFLTGNWSSGTFYNLNEAVRYNNNIYICILPHRNQPPDDNSQYWSLGVSSKEKTFSIDIIGEIESSNEWISPAFLGTIKPNQASEISISARSLINDSRIVYELISGNLPPGLEFTSNGNIIGKVRQFYDGSKPGLTRIFEGAGVPDIPVINTPSIPIYFDQSGITFDNNDFTFDRE